MDIYEYFESQDIALHCIATGRTFTPVEMAALVYRSKKTVAQKHRAYLQIIHEYPDMPVPAIPIHDFEEKPSLHEFLQSIMTNQNKEIKDFMMPKENYFYYPRILRDEGFKWGFTDFWSENCIYSTLERARADFEKLAFGNEEDVEMVCVEKYCLDESVWSECSWMCFNMEGDVIGDVEICESRHFRYIDIDMQLPPIMQLSDKAVKNAVLSTNADPQAIDFGGITELELNSPKSLDDLRYFKNLERLIINSPADSLGAYALNDYSVDLFWNNGKIHEIILRKDLKDKE